MFRVGIIGCGGIVERRHGPWLLRFSDLAEIVALAELSEERLACMGGQLSVPSQHCYTDYERMLRDEELDIAVIASPHGLHEAQAVAAFQAGAHVFIEKPIATTVEEADRMIAAASAHAKLLGVVHNQLFAPVTRKATDLIQADEIGAPFLIRSEGLGGKFVQGRGAGQDWRSTSAGGGGGPLIDNGYHQVYRILAWMGSPVTRVFARIGRFVQDIEVEDLALVLLEHENGGTTSLQAGWCAQGGAIGMDEIHGREGTIRVSMYGGTPVAIYRTSTGEWEQPDVEKEGPDELGFPANLRGFLEAVQSGDRPPVTGEDSRAVLAIVNAAYESGRTGQPVEIV